MKHSFFIFLVLGFLANASITSVNAYGVEDADTRHKITAAFDELQLLAESGDLAAQNTIAALYHATVPGVRDYRESIKWYRILAKDSGIKWASAYVGIMHYLGQGVAWDVNEAHHWLYPAAAAGHRMARALLLQSDVTR